VKVGSPHLRTSLVRRIKNINNSVTYILDMTQPITQKAKSKISNSNVPVIEKDLDSGVVAEANNDGTIYVDKDVSKNKKEEAIQHEMVHMDQIQRGDLNYDDDNVYWKGKAYPRDEMEEGNKQLPWEQEAWKANKKFKNKK